MVDWSDVWLVGELWHLLSPLASDSPAVLACVPVRVAAWPGFLCFVPSLLGLHSLLGECSLGEDDMEVALTVGLRVVPWLSGQGATRVLRDGR